MASFITNLLLHREEKGIFGWKNGVQLVSEVISSVGKKTSDAFMKKAANVRAVIVTI